MKSLKKVPLQNKKFLKGICYYSNRPIDCFSFKIAKKILSNRNSDYDWLDFKIANRNHYWSCHFFGRLPISARKIKFTFIKILTFIIYNLFLNIC